MLEFTAGGEMKNADVYMNRAVLEVNRGNLPKALDLLNDAIACAPRFAPAWTNKACVLLLLCRFDEADQSATESIKLNPRDAEAWNVKGCVCLNLRRYEAAEEAFRVAISINPRLHGAWSNLGELYRHRGNLVESESNFDRALAIEMRNDSALLGKAQIAWERQQYEKSLDYVDRAIGINGRNLAALNHKGVCLMDMGRLAEAMEFFEACRKLDPEGITALGNIGEVYRREGNFEKARECFDEVLTRDPKDVDALNNKGCVLAQVGSEEDALMYFEKALCIDPHHAGAIGNKMGTLIRLGRLQEAQEFSDAALVRDEMDRGVFVSPKKMIPNPTIGKTENTKMLEFHLELIDSTLVALRTFQALRPSYLREFMSTGRQFKETDIRDDFKKLLEMRYSNSSAECKYGDGLADVRVQKENSPLESMIFEFKIWGRNDYLSVIDQTMKYMTSFETRAAIVMVNQNKTSIAEGYLSKIIESHPGYVRESLSVKPALPESNLDHFSSRHTSCSGREVTVYHFILDTWQ